MSARLRLAAAAVLVVTGVLMPVPSAADEGGTADGATSAAAECAEGFVYDSGSGDCRKHETKPAEASCPARIGGHAVKVSGSGCVTVSADSMQPAYGCDTAQGWALVGDPPYCQRVVTREVVKRRTVTDMVPYERTYTVRVATVVTEHVRYAVRKRVPPLTVRVRVPPLTRTYMGMEPYTYTARVRYCAKWGVVLGQSVCTKYGYRDEQRTGVRETLITEPAYHYENRPAYNYRTEQVCCKPVTRTEYHDEIRTEMVCCKPVTRIVTTTRTVRETQSGVPGAVCTAAGYAMNSSSRCERPAGARLGTVTYSCTAGWAAVSGDPSTCERTLTRDPGWTCAAGQSIDRATTPPHCHPDPDADTDDDTDPDDEGEGEGEGDDDGDDCAEALGALGSGTVTRTGTWAAGCESSQKHTDQVPYWAYSYTFSVAGAATLDIDVASAGDPHVYVIDSNGTAVGSDDDSGPDGRDSRIRGLALTAGAYTIEVTTGAERATGTFTLTLIATFDEPPVVITGLADHTGYGAAGATVTASREFTVEPATAACTATTAAAGAKPKVTAGSAADKRMVSLAAAAPFSHRVTVACDAPGRSPADAEATLSAKVAVSSVTIAAGRACAASSGTADYACTVPPDGTVAVTATARGAHQGLSLSWSATGGAAVGAPTQGAVVSLAGARWSRASTAALSCTAAGTVTVTATAASVTKTATIDIDCAAPPAGPPVRIYGLLDATATATAAGPLTVASRFVILPATATCTTSPDPATVEPEQGYQRVVSARLDAPKTLQVTLTCGATGYADTTRTVALTAQLPCSEHLGTFAAAQTVRTGTITADTACVSAKRSPGTYYARRHTFTLGAAGWVTIDLAKTTTSSLDAYVLLLNGHSSNGSGTALASDDNSGTGTDSRIARRFLQPGPYTIEATTSGPGGRGAYQLTIAVDYRTQITAATAQAKLRVENGNTVTRSWTYKPTAAQLSVIVPTPAEGIDAHVTADTGKATLTATPSKVGSYDVYVPHSNGGTTTSLHTRITSYCPTGQVELPSDCATPLPAVPHWHENRILAKPPKGHELAQFCNSIRMTAADSEALTGTSRAGTLWTCRYLRPSRTYISKTSDAIKATSETIEGYGRRLVLQSEELLEGCQSITDEVWQCDYRGSLLWTRLNYDGDESDYFWDAFIRGVLNPGRCATFLTLTWGTRLANPQLGAGAIATCGSLFTWED